MFADDNKQFSLEKTRELYEFLQGKIPDGISLSYPPALTPEQAGSVIYVLQEHFRIIPDNYEQCESCNELFDSNCEGITTDDGQICEACSDDYHYCPLCEEYFKAATDPKDSFFVLSPSDAEGQDMKPGLYSVDRFPVYTSDMVTQTIDKCAVVLIKESTEYETSGFVCRTCFDENKGGV